MPEQADQLDYKIASFLRLKTKKALASRIVFLGRLSSIAAANGSSLPQKHCAMLNMQPITFLHHANANKRLLPEACFAPLRQDLSRGGGAAVVPPRGFAIILNCALSFWLGFRWDHYDFCVGLGRKVQSLLSKYGKLQSPPRLLPVTNLNSN